MDASQAIDVCPWAWRSLACFVAPVASPWWIDLARTLIATFIGAGLAFGTNYYFQYRQRRSEQKSAGNMALATLSRQYGDFVIAKAAIESDLNKASSQQPQIPLWRAIQPTLFEMNSELLFDFKSVAFLLDDGTDSLLINLVDVETKYHELRRMLGKHSELIMRVINRFSDLAWKANIPGEDFAQNAVGSAVVGELNALAEALAHRVATQEAIYIKAGKNLETLMRAKFTKGIFTFRALGAKAGLAKLDASSPVAA